MNFLQTGHDTAAVVSIGRRVAVIDAPSAAAIALCSSDLARRPLAALSNQTPPQASHVWSVRSGAWWCVRRVAHLGHVRSLSVLGADTLGARQDTRAGASGRGSSAARTSSGARSERI